MIGEAIKLAAQAIRRNVLRSSLTVLGIVIGVMAVIAMVTIGDGTTARVTQELAKLGRNLMFVVPGQFGPGRASTTARPFSTRDVEALATQVPNIRAAAPVAQKSAVVLYGGENRQVVITGTELAYFSALDWPIVAGRRFLESEERAGRAACILGQTVREKLFGPADPIGSNIRVRNISCEVIGLLEAKGQSMVGTDQDDVVIMPIRAFQRRIAGNTDVNSILISAEDGVDTGRVQTDVERVLRERRNISRGAEDDFTVRDLKQVVQTSALATTVLTGLLGSVAAVSLLVGGIGIMNIMLVSVTERTREIGIRLAIGALERQVMTQFLVEAAVLSLFGGVVGIILGLTLAWAVSYGLGVPFMPNPKTVLVAFGFAALIGLVFGFFPARRAARLNPIEALRHE